MRLKHLLSLIFVFFLFSCTSELSQFNDKAFVYANNDKKIDQNEFYKLLEEIESAEEPTIQKTFKDQDGTIDNTKVASYLVKLFNAKKLTLNADDIWQPEDLSAKPEKFNINVFLENSGSMNGYLNDPSTSFKNSVFSLLTRLKLFVDKDSLNLYLINQQDQEQFQNASNDDVEKFKNILNPASFKKLSEGKTGVSDLNDIIKRCLKRADNKNMSVFISDCIYSPGNTVHDATQYLAEQKQGIFLNFATELKNREMAVIILQLFGNFQGTYFNRFDNPIQIPNPTSRPFYIWFIGTKSQIEAILKSKKLEEIDGGYKNKLVIHEIGSSITPKYKISPKQKYGTFNRSNLADYIISDAVALKDERNKGLFGFSILVDFSNSLQDPGYFTDTSNYELGSTNFSLRVETINDKSNPALYGYTHELLLQTTELKDEALTINIVGKLPGWVLVSSSNDDTNILIDDLEKQKTFGLKYLVEGVCDAFYPKSNVNIVSKITVTIKKL